MKHIKLGIIGLSEGNGHPYSWSAIFNGYNPEFMRNCPFPIIPHYLSKQKFPEDAIHKGQVTHVWTQNRKISENIAKACNIENIANKYTDFIGDVDAILLARDDSELHLEMSRPFLEAGLPIYIDKPIALKVETAKKIYSLQKYENQIFTCSALRYAKEFHLSLDEFDQLGQIRYIDACVPKSWEKYSVHVIEPVLNIIGNQGNITRVRNIGFKRNKIVSVDWESGLKITFINMEDSCSPIMIRIFGTKRYKELTFSDSFFAFKKALQTFIEIILKEKNAISEEMVMKIVKIIEEGNINE